jgi:hypothetical protein
MTQSSSLINKNITSEQTHEYLFTSIVSHRGTPVSFAMDRDGRIFYSVLDLSSTEQKADQGSGDDLNNDKNYWSKVNFDGVTASQLAFPTEIMQVGYSVVPNYGIDKYDGKNQKIINTYSNEGKPLDANGRELSVEAIKDKTDRFYSSTARLGAKQPFQTLSDSKYVYVFRQSIAKDDPNNATPAIVNNTLLVDRFILSGTVLKLSREVRYQRSRHKTEPESRKDTLAAVDVEGNPFYEPTRELVFANHLSDGNFSVLLLPGADPEEQRWQIFTADAITGKVSSFNIRFDASIVFDTSDAQQFLEQFIEQYELDTRLIVDAQTQIRDNKDDDEIATALLSRSPYLDADIPEDALSEAIYTIRTGVIKDDFILESTSSWPLIEYEENGDIKSDYLQDGVLIEDYQFRGDNNELRPYASPYTSKNGLSSCYYYQQEMGPDGKPLKNKACVMLAAGLEDQEKNKYIGLLNFSATNAGRLSRFTTDNVNMPDINVQALDENPYDTLDQIPTGDANRVAWQRPQKMRLLDIDPNGLSTSGGVLKFAYTSASIGEGLGYSAAVEATEPYLFDDSLGRVNLYFKGRQNDFFVLYFNPTGSKSLQITDLSSPSQFVEPLLSLKPRLDRDVTIHVSATLPAGSNTCTLTMRSPKNSNEVVEAWQHLPRRCSQISDILNGDNALPLGTLEPLGQNADPRAAYIRRSARKTVLSLRTKVDNPLIFQGGNTYGQELANGQSHALFLGDLSTFLVNNQQLNIAEKTFSVIANANRENVTLKADVFYQSYLSGMVNDPEDVNKLWDYLKSKEVIQEISESPGQAHLGTMSMTVTSTDLSAALADDEIDELALELLKEGNSGDKKARRARLKQSLIALIMDVAKVRIVTFQVQDINAQSVDRLEAGLKVQVLYDYSRNFVCTPANLGGASATEWEHARSYLFNLGVNYDTDTDAATELSTAFNYEYQINNAIGQWEDWEASLALEFNPASATDGALLSINEADKLETLQPTEKGLSVEAWVKPSKELNNPGSILYYKNDDRHYSLSIKQDEDDDSKYKCVATLGDQEYTTRNSFDFQFAEKELWKHLAFTHKKYWGYSLTAANSISCGNDSSLNLIDEFTLEVLVKIDNPGSLLTKAGEYSLSINGEQEVVFNWAGTNYLGGWVETSEPSPSQQRDTQNYRKSDDKWYQREIAGKLDALKQFYKITLIRSKNKPQTNPTAAEYPLTGGNQESETGSGSGGKKWYEDKSQEDMIKGMAEKQDQMENRLELSQTNMFGSGVLGNQADPSSDPNPQYYHTLIVTKSDGSTTEWTSIVPATIVRVETFENLVMGEGGFAGTFASVRIWNRALSIGDAKTLALPENKAGLLSHWRMTEGKGTYLYDNVSENHGVATDGSWVDSPQTNQAGQFQFYVDGSPEAHDSPKPINAQGIAQFSIGGTKTVNGSQHHFNGTLDEIRIWNVPRTNEQITDNAFGRLKGEWEQLLANYTFDIPINLTTGSKVQDASVNSVQLTVYKDTMLREVLSTAPIATEIPQVRSALTGVLTAYNGTLHSRPGIVEYGDVQKNDDGTLNGILKRCYAFIDKDKTWHRMTGYKVGNLVSQWYGQAQFAPQVMGYLEGPPPVPAENFPIGSDSDVRTYAYSLNNSISFNQAEEVAYNYSTSKEAGWNVAVESEGGTGVAIETLIAPFGLASLSGEPIWQLHPIGKLPAIVPKVSSAAPALTPTVPSAPPWPAMTMACLALNVTTHWAAPAMPWLSPKRQIFTCCAWPITMPWSAFPGSPTPTFQKMSTSFRSPSTRSTPSRAR